MFQPKITVTDGLGSVPAGITQTEPVSIPWHKPKNPNAFLFHPAPAPRKTSEIHTTAAAKPLYQLPANLAKIPPMAPISKQTGLTDAQNQALTGFPAWLPRSHPKPTQVRERTQRRVHFAPPAQSSLYRMRESYDITREFLRGRRIRAAESALESSTSTLASSSDTTFTNSSSNTASFTTANSSIGQGSSTTTNNISFLTSLNGTTLVNSAKPTQSSLPLPSVPDLPEHLEEFQLSAPPESQSEARYLQSSDPSTGSSSDGSNQATGASRFLVKDKPVSQLTTEHHYFTKTGGDVYKGSEETAEAWDYHRIYTVW